MIFTLFDGTFTAPHRYLSQGEKMKKTICLLPLLLGIIACGSQSMSTQKIPDINSATLTAIAQNNSQTSTLHSTSIPTSTAVFASPTMLTAASLPPSSLTDRQPAIPETWKTFNHGDYTLSYPSAYSIDPTDPVIVITDSKTTYDSWHNNSVDSSGLIIQVASLGFDRRLDPYKDPGSLATLEQALQREINNIGIPYEVSGSTDVPWKNAGGGGETSNGSKWMYPSLSYQNTILGTTSAAKVVSDNKVYYFILVPNDDSYFLRIIVQPASSVLIKVADQILSTFTFTH
jgi:hypothetical protein